MPSLLGAYFFVASTASAKRRKSHDVQHTLGAGTALHNTATLTPYTPTHMHIVHRLQPARIPSFAFQAHQLAMVSLFFALLFLPCPFPLLCFLFFSSSSSITPPRSVPSYPSSHHNSAPQTGGRREQQPKDRQPPTPHRRLHLFLLLFLQQPPCLLLLRHVLLLIGTQHGILRRRREGGRAERREWGRGETAPCGVAFSASTTI